MLNSRNRYGNLSKLIIEILIVIDFGVRLFTRNFFEVLFSKSFRGLFFNLLFHSFSFRNNSVSVLYVDNNKSKIFYRFFFPLTALIQLFTHYFSTSSFDVCLSLSLYLYIFGYIVFIIIIFKVNELMEYGLFF